LRHAEIAKAWCATWHIMALKLHLVVSSMRFAFYNESVGDHLMNFVLASFHLTPTLGVQAMYSSFIPIFHRNAISVFSLVRIKRSTSNSLVQVQHGWRSRCTVSVKDARPVAAPCLDILVITYSNDAGHQSD
jgi:hypothetical protein